MTQGQVVRLDQRGVLVVSGEDRHSFLQGLISNDVNKLVSVDAGPGRALHAALLTPQGKFLHEFFIAERDGRFLIDAEADRLEDLRKRLSLYRLRSKVQIAITPELAVFAAWGDTAKSVLGLGTDAGQSVAIGGGVAFVDPRLAEAGCRMIISDQDVASLGLATGSFVDWDQFRLGLGLIDGSRDLTVEKAILLENGFDEWGSVDFQKGCYMGQELTARTKYRALIRKRLMPVELDGPTPEPGTQIMLGEEEVGEMRSSAGSRGLALIRLEALAKAQTNGTPLTAAGARVTPHRPNWMALPTDV